ncbi:hypothetical protein G6F50_018678 [Rhizopus delemar]|uniref:Uncharacterized protein n=1 Tax=Rhizopus delemar TaxID=936053 RepID=A0A9P6XLW9_9FUNG|nr:hypothetical protein G6F50_018678 [Rhizopus delemar]
MLAVMPSRTSGEGDSSVSVTREVRLCGSAAGAISRKTAVKVLPGSGPSVTVARWPTASPASTLSGTSQIASMSPDHANW